MGTPAHPPPDELLACSPHRRQCACTQTALQSAHDALRDVRGPSHKAQETTHDGSSAIGAGTIRQWEAKREQHADRCAVARGQFASPLVRLSLGDFTFKG